jgi:hypothetical protein
MLVLLVCIMALMASVYLFSAVWRATESVVQDVASVTVRSWRLFAWLVHQLGRLVPVVREGARQAHKFETWAVRRLHAAVFVYVYRFKRYMLASMIRSYRRQQRCANRVQR